MSLRATDATVPLQADQRESGVAIAGVRYRARRLSADLHPTDPGACAAHLRPHRSWQRAFDRQMRLSRTSPDGRLYSTRPVNADEAEAPAYRALSEADIPSLVSVMTAGRRNESDLSR